jgi:hypothetical protein
MKTIVIATAVVGLIAATPLAEAAPNKTHNPPVATDTCAAGKGLVLGAYFAFLKQHPECRKDQGSTASLGSFFGGAEPIKYISDCRLKTDIELVDVLGNGLRLYAYRYLGDDRLFVGVMAQDLLTDPRFSHAVVERGKHFAVDYAALGLIVVGSDEMVEAGTHALRLAA